MNRQQQLEVKAGKLRAVIYRFHLPKMTKKEIIQWMEETPNCTYCGEPIKIMDYSIDHIQPKSLGGSDGRSNLHLTDTGCNKMKGNLDDKRFRLLIAFLKEHQIYAEIRKRLKASGWRFGR